jgi:molecular chaperone IbpA
MDITHKHLFGDFARFDRYFVGLDRTLDQLNALSEKTCKAIANYPPYNIVKADENKYVIEMAVAGFGKQDIELTLDGDKLIVDGKVEADESNPFYLHRGLAARDFTRQFTLADNVVVRGAKMTNGLLRIWLEHQVQATTARKIKIDTDSSTGEDELTL